MKKTVILSIILTTTVLYFAQQVLYIYAESIVENDKDSIIKMAKP